jgi:hypothetical protein
MQARQILASGQKGTKKFRDSGKGLVYLPTLL